MCTSLNNLKEGWVKRIGINNVNKLSSGERFAHLKNRFLTSKFAYKAII